MSASTETVTPSEESFSDIEPMSFEQALSELETIVRDLENGGQELDASIAQYSRGTALKSHCEKKLTEAKLKVDKIIAQDGKPIATEESDLS